MAWPLSELSEIPVGCGKIRPRDVFSKEGTLLLRAKNCTTSKVGKHGSAKVAIEAFVHILPWDSVQHVLAPAHQMVKLYKVTSLRGICDQVLTFETGFDEYAHMLATYDSGLKLNKALWEQKMTDAKFIVVRQEPDAPDLQPALYAVIPCPLGTQVEPTYRVTFSFIPQHGARLDGVARSK